MYQLLRTTAGNDAVNEFGLNEIVRAERKPLHFGENFGRTLIVNQSIKVDTKNIIFKFNFQK